ncbi:hypothetical protein ACE0DR_25690 [Azotobacter sp. CWF10]
MQDDFVQGDQDATPRPHPLPGPFAWLAPLVLGWPLATPAQDLQGPGFAYYEVGDLESPRPGPRAPAMMLMGGGGGCRRRSSGG